MEVRNRPCYGCFDTDWTLDDDTWKIGRLSLESINLPIPDLTMMNQYTRASLAVSDIRSLSTMIPDDATLDVVHTCTSRTRRSPSIGIVWAADRRRRSTSS